MFYQQPKDEPELNYQMLQDSIGNWIDEKCPKCGTQLLGNKLGDRWCSLLSCYWSNDEELSAFSKSLYNSEP